MTEMYKTKNAISLDMRNIFTFQENHNYNLRSCIHLASRNMRTSLFRTETASRLGDKIWPLLPGELKSGSSMQLCKINRRNANQQIVSVAFLRHVFKTSTLSKSHRMKILFGIL